MSCVVALFVATPVLLAFASHDVTGTIERVEERTLRRSTQRVAVLVVNLDDAGQRFTTRLDKPWGMLTPLTGDPFVVRVVNVLGEPLTGRPTEPGWPYALVWLLLSVGACVGGPGRLLLERFIVERGAVTVTTSWTHEPMPKGSASRVRYTFRDGAGIARGLRWWWAPRASLVLQPNSWWPTCRSSHG